MDRWMAGELDAFATAFLGLGVYGDDAIVSQFRDTSLRIPLHSKFFFFFFLLAERTQFRF